MHSLQDDRLSERLQLDGILDLICFPHFLLNLRDLDLLNLLHEFLIAAVVLFNDWLFYFFPKVCVSFHTLSQGPTFEGVHTPHLLLLHHS